MFVQIGHRAAHKQPAQGGPIGRNNSVGFEKDRQPVEPGTPPLDSLAQRANIDPSLAMSQWNGLGDGKEIPDQPASLRQRNFAAARFRRFVLHAEISVVRTISMTSSASDTSRGF